MPVSPGLAVSAPVIGEIAWCSLSRLLPAPSVLLVAVRLPDFLAWFLPADFRVPDLSAPLPPLAYSPVLALLADLPSQSMLGT
jgi:hypothetical protein